MMRKYFFILLLPFWYLMVAQNVPLKDSKFDVKIASPEVSSIGRFIDKPISLSNGTVNVTIPIYNLNIANELNIPVVLNYNVQGIKVGELVGSVGLGWNVSCTSFINRTIRGERDDYRSNNGFITNLNTAESNLLKNQYDPKPNPWLDIYSEGVDTEPDLFNVTIFNKSISFTYDYHTSKFVQYPLSDYLIVPNINSNGYISGFEITDPHGNKYFFGGLDKDGNRAYAEDTGGQLLYFPDNGIGSVGTGQNVNTWYLNKIITKNGNITFFTYQANSPNTNSTNITDKNISFVGQYKYKKNTGDFELGKYDIISWATDTPIKVGSQFPVSDELIENHKTDINFNTYSLSGIQDISIKTIEFKETKIEFVQSPNVRSDQNNYSVSQIKVVNNGRSIKRFLFGQSYFNEEHGVFPDNSRNAHNPIFSGYFDKSKLRLRLDNITEKDYDNNIIQNYSFEYFPGTLPSKLSFAQDFFGYFNGKSNKELIPDIYFDYTVGNSSAPTRAGTANRSIDPDYTKIGMLKKIIYPTKGSVEIDYENNTFSVINDFDEQVFNNDLFVAEEAYITFGDETGIDENTGQIVAPLTSEFHFELYQDTYSAVTCAIEKVPISEHNGNMKDSYYLTLYKKNNDGSLSFLFPISDGTYHRSLIAGEYVLKVQRLTRTVDEGGFDNEIGSYSGSFTYFKNIIQDINNYHHLAGGLRIKSITHKNSNNTELLKTRYKYDEIINGKIESFGTLFSFPHLYTKDYYFGINKFYGLINFPLNDGSGASVLYSKVIEENISGNETIKKVYYFDNYFLPPVLSSNLDSRLRTPKFKWKIGIPSKTEYYSIENGLQKMIKKDSVIYGSKNTYSSFGQITGIRFEPRDKVLFGFLGESNPIYKTNYLFEFYPLFADFSYENKSIVTEYFNSKVLNTEIINSFDNSNHYQITSYRKQLPDSSIQETTYSYAHEKNNQYLIGKNMIGIPLETTVIKKKDSLDVVDKVLSKSEIVYPVSQTEANTKTSGLALPYQLKSTDHLGINSTEVTYDKYDLKGNILQYTTKDGIPTAIIWGYNSTQPIAKVTGVPYSVASALASESIAASDADINAGTEQTLIDKLDAFRKSIALQNAQITTYTYDPLIGVTSITPPSGIREIYKYDSANRLENIKDVNGKIIKEFQYNYKH